jgi:hypothetical protein
VQLLHRLSIRGVNGPEKLLKVIKVRLRLPSIHVPIDEFLLEPNYGPSSCELTQNQYVRRKKEFSTFLVH